MKKFKLFLKLVKIFFLSSRCASHVSPECNLGVNRVHILPPVAICPTVLDRQHSVSKEKLSQRSKNSHGTPEETQVVLVSPSVYRSCLVSLLLRDDLCRKKNLTFIFHCFTYIYVLQYFFF